MTDKEYPLDKIHQVVVHQLRNAADEIENGHGLVSDFDYDEETDEYLEEMGSTMSSTERTVTLELEYLLPE